MAMSAAAVSPYLEKMKKAKDSYTYFDRVWHRNGGKYCVRYGERRNEHCCGTGTILRMPMKITRDVIYFPSAKCIIIHYFGQGRRNRGGREVHREHIPPPPPFPNFFQRPKVPFFVMKSGLIAHLHWLMLL